MPSVTHEALVQLFRDRPELAPELLRDALGVTLPVYTEVRTESADLTQVAPTEYRADLVVLLVDGVPVLGIVVEVQLQPDAEKRLSWPVYVVTLRARLRCDACLLVVTPSADVARWARAPIDVGPGCRLEPIVLGPETVPVIDDPDEARRGPEMAVLSAMAHGADADPERAANVALAALVACLALDTEQSIFYADVVRAALGDAARSALEALMQSPQRREFQSDFARKYFALGIAKGEAEGEARGKAEGKAEGEARALLAVLEARGLAVGDEQRAHILACLDTAQLEQWVRRAVTVTATDELFG
jgi:hypothetical protein